VRVKVSPSSPLTGEDRGEGEGISFLSLDGRERKREVNFGGKEYNLNNAYLGDIAF